MKRVNPVPGACRLIAAVALALLAAACSTTGLSDDKGPSALGRTAGEGSTSAGAAGRTGTTARRGGGYYLDDGPGDSPPANLDAIPDAVPRHEPVLPRTTRPYTVFGREYQPMSKLQPYKARGIATWYGRRYHGNRTSSGEPYDMYAMTAAHPTLPIPSYVRVTNVANGRSVVVRVNDRGPFLDNRLIDLSYTAARRLDYVQDGSAEVEVELITEFGERPLVAQADKAPAPFAPATEPAASAPLAASAPPTGGERLPAAAAVEQAGLSAVAYSVPGPSGAGSRAGNRVDADAPAASQVPPIEPPAEEGRLRVETEYRFAPAATAAEPAGRAEAPPPALQGGPAGVGAPVPLLERGYWLQLGAFRTVGNAGAARERLRRQVAGLGAPLDVVSADGLFKLQAGPWPTREAARAAAERVRAATQLQPFAIER
jgi:rare lipoprotein A